MRIVTAALLGLVLVRAAPAGTDPAALTAGEVKQSLFGTCFADARTGWMVGELGRIFHTTDGGRSWRQQDAGTKRALLAVACVDQRTAWIAGKEGIVYASRDGGATWTLQKTGSARHVFGLAFADARRGHGVGDFGAMVHTEDGGTTWTVQRVPESFRLPESALDTGVDPGDVNLYGVSYGDVDHVWAVGEFGTIMASGDGGRTWSQQASPVESTLFGVRFRDARHGWAVGIDAVILATRDGGVTWTPQRTPLSQRSFYDVQVVGEHGWIVGESGAVLRSDDGGDTWHHEPLPIQLAARWIRGVWIERTGTGLAVGAEGLVFRIEGGALRRLGDSGGGS